jgi:hypothetical protein
MVRFDIFIYEILLEEMNIDSELYFLVMVMFCSVILKMVAMRVDENLPILGVRMEDKVDQLF